YEPVKVDASHLPTGSALAPKGTYGLEDAVDQELRTHRNGLAGAALDDYLNLKSALRTYGPTLTKPELHVADVNSLDAVVDGITNQMLLEAVGNVITQSSTGDGEGANVALAIRMLQMGSPTVAVGVGNFDRHSQEKQQGPLLYGRFGRMLAGIYFA